MANDPFPAVGLWTERSHTVGIHQLESRSHLVSKAPTGEPVELAAERLALLVRLEAVERRVARLEDYLRDRTWRARWQALQRQMHAIWVRMVQALRRTR